MIKTKKDLINFISQINRKLPYGKTIKLAPSLNCMQSKVNFFWFRRDLRLEDNAGLYHALKSGKPVVPVFIFDSHILDKLSNKQDARVTFIYQTILEIKQSLQALGSDLLIRYGTPEVVWKELFGEFPIANIFTNRDYEPYAIQRDKLIADLATEHGAQFHSYKDQCIFDPYEVLKDDGKPYTVFTPFSKKWKLKLKENPEFYLKAYPTPKYFTHFAKLNAEFPIALQTMGFEPSARSIPSKQVNQGIIKLYKEQRDFPAIHGTSRLGIHYRFGTISIREKAQKAMALSETYLNELIWREFYMQILFHFPHVAKGAFKPIYDLIEWRNDTNDFERWCKGETGYPLVDAGMRELNTTGFMHNRVRMVVASFLTKHLLIDWRWGEAYFAEKLLDFDLAANNGGWQWAAGSGTDAAPYFRVFNPALQANRFDPKQEYIKKWVPEYGTLKYPKPIVVHEFARNRCLETYKKALAK